MLADGDTVQERGNEPSEGRSICGEAIQVYGIWVLLCTFATESLFTPHVGGCHEQTPQYRTLEMATAKMYGMFPRFCSQGQCAETLQGLSKPIDAA